MLAHSDFNIEFTQSIRSKDIRSAHGGFLSMGQSWVSGRVSSPS
jgi:hypothetical protein